MTQPNFPNRALYHGDNIDFLRGINSGTVHLIATDPPFNKNRDFYSTPDSLAKGAGFKDRWNWDRDVQGEWWEAIKDDWRGVYEVIDSAHHSYGEGMAAFLCWLGIRLIECHRILRGDGSLYLHLDHTAHAYAKCMLDGIFGAKNFRNEIVWCYTGPSNTKRWFPRKHDNILFFTKSDKWTFNIDNVRIPYASGLHNDGTVFAKTDGDPLEVRAQETRGKLIEDWWSDIGAGAHISKHERTGYPTQKPLALYERIIKASSNPGDIVLDPFCGCATTPIAAERLGRQWVGMDIWDGAIEQVYDRLQSEGLATPDGNDQLLSFGDVHYSAEPPVRSDDNEVAAPSFKLRWTRPKAKWQRMSHKEIRQNLITAQSNSRGEVVCAGCGRAVHERFVELDHITPRADGGSNDISNRILLCRPCNGDKSHQLTLSGLRRAIHKSGWMHDESAAKLAQAMANKKAGEIQNTYE